VSIADNVRKILEELPEGIQLLAAAKAREPGEILEAVKAGIGIIGENYVQEAQRARESIGGGVEWHFIGRLQKNKVKKAVELFDMIQTVDSFEIAGEIDRRSAGAGKITRALIEINSGREPQKSGVVPEKAAHLVREISGLKNVHVMGLMTMGPPVDKAEESRRYFRETKQVFDEIRSLGIPNIEMKYLSMGMTESYRIAIEEGANIVRVGSGIFEARV
jgi:PLP dependent protein